MRAGGAGGWAVIWWVAERVRGRWVKGMMTRAQRAQATCPSEATPRVTKGTRSGPSSREQADLRRPGLRKLKVDATIVLDLPNDPFQKSRTPYAGQGYGGGLTYRHWG